MGTINLHGSLLPQYRGAAPINWAIINGETHTGVTTFKLQHQIDTGDILLNESIPIGADTTAGELHDTMKVIGADLLVQTMQGLAAGTLTEKPQDAIDAGALKHAPKLFTENCAIHWQQTALSIHNLIRGLSPFPGALTTLNGKLLKVFKSRYELMTHNLTCGQVESDQKNFIRFAVADGFVYLLELQPEGKKRMQVEDYLRGNKVAGVDSR
jgi:methionyl-tRNA formyltransferase